MAYFKYSQFVTAHQHTEFDAVHTPGTVTTFSGIYRCEGCGHEIVSTKTHPLPPQNHHQHTAAQGMIRWRLIVATK